jgi:threonine/homoserine/homoserine lactone efflux protein
MGQRHCHDAARVLGSTAQSETILFFSAFLAQFASTDSARLPQITILSACFLLLAVTMDRCYVILLAQLKWLSA